MKPAPLPEKKEHLRIPLPYFIVLIVVFIGMIIWHFYIEKAQTTDEHTTGVKDSVVNTNVQVIRNKDFSLIQPLILVDKEAESEDLLSIKQELQVIIDNKKQTKEISNVGIYLRKLTKGDWISINGNQRFLTGSLMKVPVLIYFLKVAETQHGLLDKKLTFNKPEFAIPKQTFPGKTIVLGKQYTIRELLNYMIRYSDNNATYVLNKNMETGLLGKIFRDLEIRNPKLASIENELTAQEFSRFMRVLYNGSYLNPEMSQLAMEILSESEFAIGIKRNLPKEVVVAHKFGEASQGEDLIFSESGIIYDDQEPYLLTIMATGKNNNQIIDFIGNISGFIYQKIRNR
jgi:beta-lactamase class A